MEFVILKINMKKRRFILYKNIETTNEDMSSFFEYYREAVEEFLGIKFSIELNDDEDDDEIEFIVDGMLEEIFDINEKPLTKTFDIVESVIYSFYREFRNLEQKPFLKSLFIEDCVYNLISKKMASKPQLGNFIEGLKVISGKSYESNFTNMGFIVIKSNKVNINDYLSAMKIQYLEFQDSKKLVDVLKDKQTLKLIDSQSLCFVVNDEFLIVGLAKKMSGYSSVYDIMMSRFNKIEENRIKTHTYNYFVESLGQINSTFELKFNELTKEIVDKFNQDNQTDYTLIQLFEKLNNDEIDKSRMLKYEKDLKLAGIYYEKYNEKILESYETKQVKNQFMSNMLNNFDKKDALLNNSVDFVYLEDKQIHWCISDSMILNFNNGSWKLKDYTLLSNILSYCIIKNLSHKKPHYSTHDEAKFIIEKINLIAPRVVKLFKILKSLSRKNIGSLICILNNQKRKSTIYRELLKNKDLTRTDYSLIIKTDKNMDLNIQSCDKYLFELIASIDGAVLLDSNFNILSYGEMINTNISEYNNSQIRGARTIASINASSYGIAIKVSEDGDISVFNDGDEKELVRI